MKKKRVAKRKPRWTCTIDRRLYRLVPVVQRKKTKVKKKPISRKKVRRAARAVGAVIEVQNRAGFARIVERATMAAPPWNPNSDKSLIADVFREAQPYLGAMTWEQFKRRLLAERFPLDRIDLVAALGPEKTRANDLFGRGPYSIRKGVHLA